MVFDSDAVSTPVSTSSRTPGSFVQCVSLCPPRKLAVVVVMVTEILSGDVVGGDRLR